MPYRWYYGNDGFISDLLIRHVVDPVGQGYEPASAELLTTIQQIASSLLAHDWLLANRLLDAVGTPEILVRGDIEANFPGRDIIDPAALAAALSHDPGVSVVYHDGPLRVFRLRRASGELVTASHVVTVDSAVPDLRADHRVLATRRCCKHRRFHNGFSTEELSPRSSMRGLAGSTDLPSSLRSRRDRWLLCQPLAGHCRSTNAESPARTVLRSPFLSS
jgi:hypothetical protein